LERRTAANASSVETNRAFFMQMLSLVRIDASLVPSLRSPQARIFARSGRSPGNGRMSKLARQTVLELESRATGAAVRAGAG
jgi:hypothetical protein